MSALSELYKTDFHAWTLKAAELIRQHRFDEVNTDDLAEELDSMGKKERNEIANRLVVLLAHLLKWQFQPAYRSTSWRSSIIEQRKQIQRQIQSSPSVKPYVPEAVDDAYPDYAIDQILDFDFYPNEP
jgi:hypothetical protein